MNKELTIGSRIKHAKYGDGIICRIGLESFTISFFEGDTQEIDRKSEELEVVEVLEGFSNMVTKDEIEDIFYNLMQRYTDATEKVELGEKWKGGVMLLKAFDSGIQPKEIPIDTFFHKIVMLRDRLRVLEQNINSHKVLTDEEKVNIQQYITRIYGTLTTFNVLFKYKDDYFVGEKGS
ncbi:MAG: hypothetical protein Q8K70_02100 [Bacteroidota bacterium]|nr:hypothetical protein [Bacteroidota bacterium]